VSGGLIAGLERGFGISEWYVQPNFPLLLVLYGDIRGAVGRR